MYRIYTKKIGIPDGYLRKLLFIMRLTTVILIISLMQVSAKGLAQKITINKANAPLSLIINEIRNQSGYDFFYSNELLKKANRVTINVKDASLEEVLNICFNNQPLTFKVDDKAVLLKEKSRSILDVIVLAFNNIDVRIVVTTEDGLPLPGATVTVKGTPRKVITGNAGVVVLNNVDENAVLLITYLGYKAQEVKLKNGKPTITIKMQPEENKMDDVVVTGIFNKRKESYTGAVKVITETELKQFQGRNIFTTLGNIDPSFYVVTNNMAGADPNKIPNIQIRAARSLPNIDQLKDNTSSGALNTPLIILDGFETTLQRMMDLDNNEIESITLLKDGSATALYGSRGANGVVVIKTKEPVAGSLRLSYRAGVNLSIPDLSSYHLLNSAQKLELERLSGFYESSTKTPEANIRLQQYYNQVLGQVNKGVNTDWLSIPLRTQLDQTHNLKVEGGDQTFRYNLGLQYNKLNGVMKGSGRRTFNGTINLSYKYKDLTFRNNLVIGQTKSDESPYGSFSDYVKLNPYWEPYDATGKINQYFTPFAPEYGSFGRGGLLKPYASPLYDATLNTFNKQGYTSITDNFQLEWMPLSGLSLRAGVGVNGNLSDADNFKPADHSSFAGYTDEDIFRKGSYSYSSGKEFNFTGNLNASYSKLFNDIHRVYVGVNLDASQNSGKNYTFDLEGFPDGAISFASMALQYKQNGKPGGFESIKRRVGALVNANYALKDRYLADFSYRLDGASQFGVNRRFAPFWAAGLGWNMHYESFVKDNLKFIDRLKIRGSYGSTGSTQFSAFQAIGTYSYLINDRYKTWLGARQNSLGNPDLQWQQTNKFDLGIEGSIFKNRITFEADIFNEKTTNLLSALDLPYSNGFTSYNENIGAVQTKGFELAATVWVIKSDQRRFSWSITGNLIHSIDKIGKLSEAMKKENEKLQIVTGLDVFNLNRIIKEGASQNAIYAVRSLGIDPSTGKELFLNRFGEVTYNWNPADRIDVGVDQPTYRGSFSTMFRYNNFTMNASFGYRFGGQLYNQTLIDRIENADRQMNVDARVYTDRWKQPGDVTFFRGINETSRIYPSTRFVQNERTLTCQNVSLMYDVYDKKFLKRLGLQSLGLSGNTGELFYISTVRQERGLSYPFTRQFSMSLYASF